MVVRREAGPAGDHPSADLLQHGLTPPEHATAPASGGTLTWYLRRAAVMPPRELGHRVVEQIRRSLSRLDKRGWERFDIGNGPLTPLSAFKVLADAPWPEGLEALAFPHAASEPFKFLGQTWPESPFASPQDAFWHKDPVTGTCWPAAETFCFDVNWRQAANKSDVKFVLELNRLQHLQAVSTRALREGNAAAAHMAADMLIDWMNANPPFYGVNWLSGIELALRLVSAAFVVSALDATSPGHSYDRALRRFVAAHAYWLDRFPSLHSSANNHLVAEGLGLVVAAGIVPDLSAKYGRKGQAILSEAVHTQFHDDGTGVEQSPTYAAFTLEMLLLGVLIEKSQGDTPPADRMNALGRAASHLKSLLDTGGRHPRIGDDDEGRVIVTSPAHEDRYTASIVAAAAGVLDRPGLAPPARSTELRDLLFAPPSRPSLTPSGISSFPSGGYSVIREKIAGRSMLLVMDHGPVGFDPLAAHGHADALSIWMHLDDQPVFVDAGTYRYNASDGWREWLRSTPAHNTLAIEDESQSLTAGDFNWRHKANSKLVELDTGANWRLNAWHDGYFKRFGVFHHRACRRVDNGFMIEDRLTPPNAGLDAVVGFLVHPALTVTPCANGALLSKDGDKLVRVTSRAQMPAVCTIASSAYSSAYNALEPANRIEFRLSRSEQPHSTLIEIVAGRGVA
ncbi:heparinase II/III family protein [Aliihoeflea sp. PC F10.4]